MSDHYDRYNGMKELLGTNLALVDLLYPKRRSKKPRKKHTPSIIQPRDGGCYLCEKLHGDYSIKRTEEHHVYFGPGAVGKVVTPNGEVYSCDFEGDPQKATGVGYVSHFSSCPNADQHRRR